MPDIYVKNFTKYNNTEDPIGVTAWYKVNTKKNARYEYFPKKTWYNDNLEQVKEIETFLCKKYLIELEVHDTLPNTTISYPMGCELLQTEESV